MGKLTTLQRDIHECTDRDEDSKQPPNAFSAHYGTPSAVPTIDRTLVQGMAPRRQTLAGWTAVVLFSACTPKGSLCVKGSSTDAEQRHP
jgi:hypothetical protein